jgi:hypothetical protein
VDAGFGDRDCLLFHGFVDCDLVADVHFVEFVDGADAAAVLFMLACCLGVFEVGIHTANIRAPASIVNSPVSASFTTEAVKPAADEALPLV